LTTTLHLAAFEAWQQFAKHWHDSSGRDPSRLDFEDWLRASNERFSKAGFPSRLVEWLSQWHRGEVRAVGQIWVDHHRLATAAVANAGVTLAFIGSRGTGKSQLGTIAGWHVCFRGLSAIYTRTAMLFARIKATYGSESKETELKILKEIVAVPLLVLDEIGETRETEWEGKLLANIVCQRHDDGRDTILISNQSAESLARSIGESVTDRIAEGPGIFEFNWKSFRRLSH
jgi:DNA replication protein DnaC